MKALNIGAKIIFAVALTGLIINCSQLMSQKEFNNQRNLIETRSVLGDGNVLQQFDGGSDVNGGSTTSVVSDNNTNGGGTTGGTTTEGANTGGGTTGGTTTEGTNTGGGTTVGTTEGTTNGGTNGTTNDGTTTVVQAVTDNVTPLDLTINRMCSADPNKTYHWRWKQVSIMENDGLFVRVREGNNVFCTIDEATAKPQLISGNLSLPTACYGPYTKEEFQQNLAYVDRDKAIKLEVIVLKGTEEVQINDPFKWTNNGFKQQQDPSWIYLDRNPNNTNCDKKQSPLFVDFRGSEIYDRISALSSPANGVLFDILGENVVAPQVAHQKMQISWFQDPGLMFIALPDQNGKINGINELFGNNTVVPVREQGQERFADNGFAALSRYDGYVPAGVKTMADVVADGFIDANDYIYSKLRLWSDMNANGTVEAGELHTLDEMGIVYISLNFDAKHKEADKYKNEIRYKASAKNANGGFNLVFDVWFHTQQ